MSAPRIYTVEDLLRLLTMSRSTFFTLRRDAKAAIAGALHDAFGALDDPKVRARRLVRDARACLDELAQFIEVA